MWPASLLGSNRMRWWWTCCIPFRSLWGRVPSKLSHLVSWIQFPVAGGMRPPFHCCLSAWSSTHLLEAACTSSPCGPLQIFSHASDLSARAKALVSACWIRSGPPQKSPCPKIDYLWPELHLQNPPPAIQFNTIMGVISYWLFIISTGSIHIQWEEIIQS